MGLALRAVGGSTHALTLRVARAARGWRSARLPVAEALQPAPRTVLASEHRPDLPAAPRSRAPRPRLPSRPTIRHARPTSLSAHAARRTCARHLAHAATRMAGAAPRRD